MPKDPRQITPAPTPSPLPKLNQFMPGDMARVTPEFPAHTPMDERLGGEHLRVTREHLDSVLNKAVGAASIREEEDKRILALLTDPVSLLREALRLRDPKLAYAVVGSHRVLRQIGEILWSRSFMGTWNQALEAVPESIARGTGTCDATAKLKGNVSTGDHLRAMMVTFANILDVTTLLRKYPDDVLELVSPRA